MNKELKDGFNFPLLIKGLIWGFLSVAITIFLFSILMYYTQSMYDYATIFATLSVAIGSFISAIYIGKKRKHGGIGVGFLVGIIYFIVVTIGGFIADKGAVGYNTLFHLVIILLSALIGGILGVNSKNKNKFV